MQKNNRSLLVVRMLAAIMLAVMIGSLVACGNGDQASSEQAAAQAPEAEKPAASVEVAEATKPAEENLQLETKYMTLLYPKAFVDCLQHREVTEEDVAMEIFSMAYKGTEMELFRLYFGDETVGVVLGYLTVADAEIPVSYTVSEYQDVDFPEAEARDLYYRMMDGFGTVLNTINNDNRFSLTKSVKPVNYTDCEMKYWQVSLPEHMDWVESEENGIYRIDFYGTICGDRLPLYTIYLGETQVDSVLGYFKVDGKQLPVGIVTHGIMPGEGWTDDNMTEAYRSMETIDLVISAITSSRDFSK